MLATGSSVMMMAESTKPQGQGVGGGGTKQKQKKKKKKKERKGSRMFCDGTSTPTRHHLLPSVRESKRDGTNERASRLPSSRLASVAYPPTDSRRRNPDSSP
ncbi:hypothetical protein AXG93_1762s1170 [Marchantia polymorpha subsp. ruderalis]|uniref:Uncharacterized protein n=1 Tax=Marchantia polymorpha subsp. ruderalis TaxID=1480154 RepID=A0A176W984_MARPO|nr:hypothetical protein AXG93_1762s1170 [Marchantia polymorpha subsp. ruderalis]